MRRDAQIKLPAYVVTNVNKNVIQGVSPLAKDASEMKSPAFRGRVRTIPRFSLALILKYFIDARKNKAGSSQISCDIISTQNDTDNHTDDLHISKVDSVKDEVDEVLDVAPGC